MKKKKLTKKERIKRIKELDLESSITSVALVDHQKRMDIDFCIHSSNVEFAIREGCGDPACYFVEHYEIPALIALLQKAEKVFDEVAELAE